LDFFIHNLKKKKSQEPSQSVGHSPIHKPQKNQQKTLIKKTQKLNRKKYIFIQKSLKIKPFLSVENREKLVLHVRRNLDNNRENFSIIFSKKNNDDNL
jgi:hypothetical protein